MLCRRVEDHRRSQSDQWLMAVLARRGGRFSDMVGSSSQKLSERIELLSVQLSTEVGPSHRLIPSCCGLGVIGSLVH